MDQGLRNVIVTAFSEMRIHNSTRRLTLWSIDLPVAFFLAEYVKPHWKTLETGCGLTTVLFSALGTCHYCLVPSLDEVDRLKAFCNAKGIVPANVQFFIERSEYGLPNLNVYDFDAAVIDGRHAFPSPFVDFYYIADRLKVGGTLIVDDTCLWTGRVLSEFLQTEREWRLTKRFRNTVVFEKLHEGTHDKEWNEQPFVTSRSWRTVGLFRCRQMSDTLVSLLRARDFKTLRQKVTDRILKAGIGCLSGRRSRY